MLHFKNRLKKLRKDKKLTQQDFANIIGYSRSTIAKYESGSRMPSNNFLIEVADYFEVSLDYMLGRTDLKLSLSKYLSKYSQSILLFVNSENGEILGQSPDAAEFYGFKKEELLHMTIFDITAMSKEKMNELLKEAAENKHSSFYMTSNLKNGENKEVKVTTTTLLVANKKIIGLLIQDISNMKIKSESEEKVDSLIISLSKIGNKRNPYKIHFAENVADLANLIGRKLSLSDEDLNILKKAALLHDIGEFNVPTDIINKPDRRYKQLVIIQHKEVADLCVIILIKCHYERRLR
ncbi:MAG: helix-turn-helix domain-containing protein [bacterium]